MSSLTVALSPENVGFHDLFYIEIFQLIGSLKLSKNINIIFNHWSCQSNSSIIDFFILDLKQLIDCNMTNFQIPQMSPLAKFSVLMPTYHEVPRYKYIAMPFDLYVGLCVILTSIVFGLATAFISKYHRNKLDIVQQIIAGILLSSSQSTHLPSSKEVLLRYVYLLMIIFGLIFTNLYGAFLSSFLVTGIPKIFSTILCSEHAANVLRPHLPKFTFNVVSYMEYNTKIRTLDSESAFCISDNSYSKFTYYQKALKSLFYRLEISWISDITYATLVILNKHSLHFEMLQDFIGVCYSSGLTNKWFQMSAAAEFIYMKWNVPESADKFLNIIDLKLVFLGLLVGFSISIIVFAIEFFLGRKVRKNGSFKTTFLSNI